MDRSGPKSIALVSSHKERYSENLIAIGKYLLSFSPATAKTRSLDYLI